MSVQFVHASIGKEFVPTKLGEEEGRVYVKYQKEYSNSQYRTIVPKSWLTKGWVEEIDKQEKKK